ncbi:MAG: SDR family NAD(P)-dependent oxidoreductase [Acidimicrobiales bacterium]
MNALITGASRGLGEALARALANQGFGLVLDARGATELEAVAASLSAKTAVVAVAGSVAEPAHRAALIAAASSLGGLDLLVNNASILGPSPQPTLAEYPLDVLGRLYDINVLAPLGLAQLALPLLRSSRQGTIVDITSDAAVEGYEGWGGYGSSKAALEQLSNVFAAEQPDLRVYRFDPGDMRTRMHQEAFPGEDISDRATPDEVAVPALLRLLEERPTSGRYRANELVGEAVPR